MRVSEYPPHAADRHLEIAQALSHLIEMIAEAVTEEDWQDARQGLLSLSRQIEHQVNEAREILDDA